MKISFSRISGWKLISPEFLVENWFKLVSGNFGKIPMEIEFEKKKCVCPSVSVQECISVLNIRKPHVRTSLRHILNEINFYRNFSKIEKNVKFFSNVQRTVFDQRFEKKNCSFDTSRLNLLDMCTSAFTAGVHTASIVLIALIFISLLCKKKHF